MLSLPPLFHFDPQCHNVLQGRGGLNMSLLLLLNPAANTPVNIGVETTSTVTVETSVQRARHLVTNSAPCAPAPDSADNHAVTFSVPSVHLNGFPDGQYHVAVQVTNNWDKSLFRYLIGPPRVDPLAHLVVLTKDRPVASIEFNVYRRRFRFFW